MFLSLWNYMLYKQVLSAFSRIPILYIRIRNIILLRMCLLIFSMYRIRGMTCSSESSNPGHRWWFHSPPVRGRGSVSCCYTDCCSRYHSCRTETSFLSHPLQHCRCDNVCGLIMVVCGDVIVCVDSLILVVWAIIFVKYI